MGLSYVSDNQSGTLSNRTITWHNLGSLMPGESRFIQLVARVNGDVLGELINLVDVTGKPPSGDNVSNSTTANVIAFRPNIEVFKWDPTSTVSAPSIFPSMESTTSFIS